MILKKDSIQSSPTVSLGRKVKICIFNRELNNWVFIGGTDVEAKTPIL